MSIPSGFRNKHHFNPRAVTVSSRIRVTVDFHEEIVAHLEAVAEELKQLRAQTSALLANVGQWEEKDLDVFKENAAALIRLQATVDTLDWVLRAAGIAPGGDPERTQ